LGRESLPLPDNRNYFVIKLHIKEMHFKNVYHWAHMLYKNILNTFKSLIDCTSLLHYLCNSCVMVVSKPIHFEEVISIMSCTGNDILFYFCIKNDALFNSDSVCTCCGHGLCYFHW